MKQTQFIIVCATALVLTACDSGTKPASEPPAATNTPPPASVTPAPAPTPAPPANPNPAK